MTTRLYMPDFYRPPMGAPLRWQDDVTGKLPRAVFAFLGGQHTCTPEELALVADYLLYYIKAPCWKTEAGPEIFAALRAATVETLSSREALDAWLMKALEVGIDPL